MRVILIGFFLCISQAASATLMLDIDNSTGQLLGGKGLEVNGVTYDITFTDGTCIELFNGCDEATDFTLRTFSEAFAVGSAILRHMLVDTDKGLFDSNPELTEGISNTTTGIILVPYGIESIRENLFVRYVETVNFVDGWLEDDFTNISDITRAEQNWDTNPRDFLVFAMVSLSNEAAVISEPSSQFAFLLMLLVAYWLVISRTKQRKNNY